MAVRYGQQGLPPMPLQNGFSFQPGMPQLPSLDQSDRQRNLISTYARVRDLIKGTGDVAPAMKDKAAQAALPKTPRERLDEILKGYQRPEMPEFQRSAADVPVYPGAPTPRSMAAGMQAGAQSSGAEREIALKALDSEMGATRQRALARAYTDVPVPQARQVEAQEVAPPVNVPFPERERLKPDLWTSLITAFLASQLPGHQRAQLVGAPYQAAQQESERRFGDATQRYEATQNQENRNYQARAGNRDYMTRVAEGNAGRAGEADQLQYQADVKGSEAAAIGSVQDTFTNRLQTILAQEKQRRDQAVSAAQLGAGVEASDAEAKRRNDLASSEYLRNISQSGQTERALIDLDRAIQVQEMKGELSRENAQLRAIIQMTLGSQPRQPSIMDYLGLQMAGPRLENIQANTTATKARTAKTNVEINAAKNPKAKPVTRQDVEGAQRAYLAARTASQKAAKALAQSRGLHPRDKTRAAADVGPQTLQALGWWDTELGKAELAAKQRFEQLQGAFQAPSAPGGARKGGKPASSQPDTKKLLEGIFRSTPGLR